MRPQYEHAEIHGHYMPKTRDPRLTNMELLLSEVNKMKVQSPNEGTRIYDQKIDEIVQNAKSLTQSAESLGESASWSAAQRVVWRSSKMSAERKLQILGDRVTTADVVAYAVVNHGRWIVNCPSQSCAGAQYASFDDQMFWCVDCNNQETGGQWIPVIWPPSVADIEGALSLRPIQSRNWVPDITPDDLIMNTVSDTKTMNGSN
jgi:hypothetical protein